MTGGIYWGSDRFLMIIEKGHEDIVSREFNLHTLSLSGHQHSKSSIAPLFRLQPMIAGRLYE